jgi:hypothetical protein
VAVALMKWVDRVVDHTLRGTSEQLLEDLGEEVSDDVKRSRAWPKAPNALSRRLNRLAPLLREAGIEYSEDEVGHAKTKIKILRKIDDRGGEGSSQDGTSSDRQPASDASRPSSETHEEVDDNLDGFNFFEDEDPEGGHSHG